MNEKSLSRCPSARSRDRLRSGTIAFACSLLPLVAAAEISPTLKATIDACTMPDITFADRLGLLDAAGAIPLTGDARLQAARAIEMGWALVDHANSDPVANLPALMLDVDATAAKSAVLEPKRGFIWEIEWRSLDAGRIAVHLFQPGRQISTCVIIAPEVELADVVAFFPFADETPLQDSLIGTVAILSADAASARTITLFQPDAAAIQPAWAGPIPGTYIRIFEIPTLKAR